MSADDQGYLIRTTQGDVVVDASVGVVLPHEHIFCDSRIWWEGPGSGYDFDTLETLATATAQDVAQNPQRVTRENMILSDWHIAERELTLARNHGVGVIIDLTVTGSKPHPELAAHVAAKAGIHLVTSVGRYLKETLSEAERAKSVAQLSQEWLGIINERPGGIPIGIIGEIGTSEEIQPEERISLEAAAAVQQESGLAINVHTHPFAQTAVEALKIISNCGGDTDRVAISHLDGMFDLDYYRQILDLGAYVEFDNFGTSRARFVNGANYPDDSERIEVIEKLIELDYVDQLLLSHDINHRNSLESLGGWGYGHISRHIVPILDDKFGTDIRTKLTTVNPLRLICLNSTT